MISHRLVIFAALCLGMFSSACSGDKQHLDKAVIPDTLMSDILVEFAIADAARNYSISRPDYPRFKAEMFYDAILAERGTNREAFVNSLEYYSIHTSELLAIYEDALNELSKRQAEAVK